MLYPFLFRCLAGCFFAVLFLYRGFGITAGRTPAMTSSWVSRRDSAGRRRERTPCRSVKRQSVVWHRLRQWSSRPNTGRASATHRNGTESVPYR